MSSNIEHDEKLEAPADFDGPTQNRHCTDILMLLLLFCMWAAMTGIGIYACINGDWRIVVYPLDYDGNVCGTDFGKIDMTDYPYLYYVNSFTGGVCVKECPSLEGQTSDNLTDIYTMVTYAGMWQVQNGNQSELPLDFVQVGNYSTSDDAIACTDELCFPNDSPVDSWSSQGIRRSFGFSYYVGDTYQLLWRCYLTSAAEERIAELVSANGTSLTITDQAYNFYNKLYGDLWVARKYILGFGCGVALGISFFYIFLMRLPLLLNSVVWGSIFITIAMFGLAGYYAWTVASDWEDAEPQIATDNQILATRIASIVLYVIGGLIFLLTCCLRRQIQIAIGCVKQAGRAVNSMMLILLVPVLQAAGLVAFLVILMVYAVYLASLGEISIREIPLDVQGQQEIAYRVYEF